MTFRSKKHIAGKLAFLGLLVLTATAASASTFIITDDELDPEIFPQVAESMRENLDGPDAPNGLTSARKQDVLRSLSRIESYLDENPDENATKIRNEQRRINAALAPTIAKNDGRSDVVCRRIKKVGSNIPTTECRTRAEIERDQQFANEELQRMQQGKTTF